MSKSMEELRITHRDHWIVCAGCGRQAWPGVNPTSAPWTEAAKVLYASSCADCPRVFGERQNSFAHWLCHGRSRGTFDAVGMLALAIKEDANCLMLGAFHEYAEYLGNRGFDITALPAAWAEWEQWKGAQVT